MSYRLADSLRASMPQQTTQPDEDGHYSTHHDTHQDTGELQQDKGSSQDHHTKDPNMAETKKNIYIVTAPCNKISSCLSVPTRVNIF